MHELYSGHTERFQLNDPLAPPEIVAREAELISSGFRLLTNYDPDHNYCGFGFDLPAGYLVVPSTENIDEAIGLNVAFYGSKNVSYIPGYFKVGVNYNKERLPSGTYVNTRVDIRLRPVNTGGVIYVRRDKTAIEENLPAFEEIAVQLLHDEKAELHPYNEQSKVIKTVIEQVMEQARPQ